MQKFKQYTGELSAQLIDEFSEYTSQILQEEKVSSKDVVRFRLSLESAMCEWLEKLGQGGKCTLEAKKRFGKLSVSVSCEGAHCDPRKKEEDEFGTFTGSSLMETLGLTIGYRYQDGMNRLSFMPKKQENGSRFKAILIGLLSGLTVSVAILNLVPSWAPVLNEQLVAPVFTAMMSLLKTIAGPLIFLAVMFGIYGIGDIKTFGKLGKKLVFRFILMSFVAGLLATAGTMPFVTVCVAEAGSGGISFSEIFSFILQFIPTDIFSPFIEGNMMQIIFISICCGIGMLVLGKNVQEYADVFNQIFSLVQLMMEALANVIPVFIFFSMMDFVLSGYWRNVERFLIPFLVIAASTIVLALIINTIRIKTKLHAAPGPLLKKMMPTFLTALATASSAAAFSVNIEACEKKLGIDQGLTRFGIPLGQVIYMPLAAVEFITITMIVASEFGTRITPIWLVTMVFMAVILAVATPPIPGGGLTIFTILFLQLGIPQEAIGIAISIDLIVDYLVTAGDLLCLQQEVLLCAHSMNMLDLETLRKR